MWREPSLTFEGALKLLGHRDPRWIKKLDTALGAGFLVGGTIGTVAAGPAALPALGMFAAVWAWLEPKDQAIELLKQAVGKLSEKFPGSAGYERRQLIAAAHTTIVVAAFFEVLRDRAEARDFDKLQIPDKAKAALISHHPRSDFIFPIDGGQPVIVEHGAEHPIFQSLYVNEIPAPYPALGFDENSRRLYPWYRAFSEDVRWLLRGIASMKSPEVRKIIDRINWDNVADEATDRYRSLFLGLAATVPEFAIWASLGEHAATRSALGSVGDTVRRVGDTVADVASDVRKAGDAVADIGADIGGLRAAIDAALEVRRDALGRVEALLALGAAPGDAPRDLRGIMNRANRGVLTETIIPVDAHTYGPDIKFPSVDQIYINPQYRAMVLDSGLSGRTLPGRRAQRTAESPHASSQEAPASIAAEAAGMAGTGTAAGDAPGSPGGGSRSSLGSRGTARVADERWWEQLPSRDDFDLMLAGHVTCPNATRVPMLLLGHPGAGKSMLVKLLAARLPASEYTVVRVALRRVGAHAPIIDQIRDGLDLATHGRVREWWQLAEQGGDTVRVVLLDGLDELLQASQQDRSGYLQEVAEFQRVEAEQGAPVVVMVTSRTVVADRVTIPDGTTVVKLDPFSDEDIIDWISRWRNANWDAITSGRMGELTLHAAHAQPELARQPLLLLMLALYAADRSMPLIDQNLGTAELYRRLLGGFAEREAAKELDRDRRGAKPGDLGSDDLKRLTDNHLSRLEIAALGMFNRGRQDVGEDELGKDLDALDSRLMTRSRPVEAGQRIIGEFFFVHAPEARTMPVSDAAEARSRQFATARRAYEFLHATFGEYLVAQRIMDELADVAMSAFDRRHSSAEPDDSRLFALLCHQPLAVRSSTIDFAISIYDDLPSQGQARIAEVLEVLLSNYRAPRAEKYSAYRPTPPDQVRQLACYSANLVSLRIMLGREPTGVPVAKLLRAPDGGMGKWRSTVRLWKAGLDSDGLQAVLDSVEIQQVADEAPVVTLYPLSSPESHFSGSRRGSAFNGITFARLAGDEALERYLRYGAAAADSQTYTFHIDTELWADTVASRLIAAIVGEGVNFDWLPHPPSNTSRRDIARIAELIFSYLKFFNDNPESYTQLLKLLFALPRVFDIDELALAAAVIKNPRLRDEVPELRASEIYGEYAAIVHKASMAGVAEENQRPRRHLPRNFPPEIRNELAWSNSLHRRRREYLPGSDNA